MRDVFVRYVILVVLWVVFLSNEVREDVGMTQPKPKSYPVIPGWQLLLKDLGVGPVDVLRRAGLPEDLLHQEKASLTTEELFRFWQSIEVELGDPLFPLRLAEVVTTFTMSPPIFASICSEDLLSAAHRLSAYKRLIGPMALHVRESDEELELEMEWFDTLRLPPSTLAVSELLFLLQMARLSTRQRVCPLRVSTPLPPECIEAYQDFIGVPIERGESHTIVYSMEVATIPFLTANESMRKILESSLQGMLVELDASSTTSERVRSVLLESLPGGVCSVSDVSRKLSLGKRTLQRRLSRENTSFQAILDSTRLELAQHYLTSTSISSPEISFLLGFEEPNSFYRAFQGWTGKTPEQVRRTVSL